jgi:hypothetical protein
MINEEDWGHQACFLSKLPLNLKKISLFKVVILIIHNHGIQCLKSLSSHIKVVRK